MSMYVFATFEFALALGSMEATVENGTRSSCALCTYKHTMLLDRTTPKLFTY